VSHRDHPGREPRRPFPATDTADRDRAVSACGVRARKRGEAEAVRWLQPNTSFQERTGFGGYKQACFDTVTFRIVTEPGARVAGLRTGELQGVEDLPTKSVADLKQDKNITILPLNNWWIQIANPNISNPPTDKLLVRKAIQAALDMDEVMDAASDGNYRLNVGFQYPNQPDYTDAGKETYNLHNPELAKNTSPRLAIRGAGGPADQQGLPADVQLGAGDAAAASGGGINAQMKVVDWPTSVQMAQNTIEGWNFHFTGWGTQPALGGLATMQFLVQPNASYKPVDGKDDPDVLAAWNDMNALPTAEGRQQAFARMQKLVLERVYAVPFGSFTKVQGVGPT